VTRVQIKLHKIDTDLLNLVQEFFCGIGEIYNPDSNSVEFRVSSLKDINNVIIPHLDKYPLLTQKKADYLLFKQVVNIVNNKQHLTREGLIKIISIRASINKGLSETLSINFPGITPIARPLVESIKIHDPN
jgi:hypothetical protein